MTDASLAATPDKTALRHAATVIVLRRDAGEPPRVLMGQRAERAAFMPSKFVFPGGAVDLGDWNVPLSAPLGAPNAARLAHDAPDGIAPALAAAAIRELWEETGMILGARTDWPDAAPPDWQGFADLGFCPAASDLHFVFRAITPPGRPRRFDARFFLVDAEAISNDPDDFSRACDELSHLQWVPLSEARALNLPFITEVVLAEISALLRPGQPISPPASVPFFDNRGPASRFLAIET
ncbi:DNA mismatch repair protein MutT [Thioclava dalianensis]|uniref:DNA mismatch repair protein MutT n=1 Tax=Thioclava dalianensis TaxID=1185766 RepID=A0A074TDG4_9RHOB|nr:NUDIX hydrolase [Thioclava dalianensis]KEP69806.1 DNA mismatch repair protein MutT [Thioclava dalianensis]SFM86226.1 8-oxo-dGTP pyrophosphatase MutT, NUDIX family [Thioclava dalianensis]